MAQSAPLRLHPVPPVHEPLGCCEDPSVPLGPLLCCGDAQHGLHSEKQGGVTVNPSVARCHGPQEDKTRDDAFYDTKGYHFLSKIFVSNEAFQLRTFGFTVVVVTELLSHGIAHQVKSDFVPKPVG